MKVNSQHPSQPRPPAVPARRPYVRGRPVARRSIPALPLQVITGLVLIMVLALMVVPFGWLVIASFKSNIEFFSDPFGLPHTWSFDNYATVFSDEPMLLYLWHSAVAAGASTTLAVGASTMASYALLYRFRVRHATFLFLSFGLFVPVNALMTPYYFIVTDLGLYDSIWGLVLVYAGVSAPICFLIVKTYMDSIPREILEASYVDGASFHRTFLRIVLPLSVPGMVTASVFLMIIAWNELLFANLLTQSDAARTVQVAIRFFLAAFHANYPEAFAAMIIAILPTVVAYVLLSKRIIAGLTTGAVK
jgi:raffinose/stachyose/melibiose transport system permease protein